MPTRIYTNRIDGEQRIHVEINAAEICDILDDFTPAPDAFASTKQLHRLLLESLAVFSPTLAESHKATADPAPACGEECVCGHGQQYHTADGNCLGCGMPCGVNDHHHTAGCQPTRTAPDNPAASDDGLRTQYAAAIAADDGHPWDTLCPETQGSYLDNADAVLAVRDRRMQQLTAGRATWKAKAAEIEADRDRLLTEFPWLRASDEDRQASETALAMQKGISADPRVESRARGEKLVVAEARLAAIQRLADRYPVGIDTAHLHAALDGQDIDDWCDQPPTSAPASCSATLRMFETVIHCTDHRPGVHRGPLPNSASTHAWGDYAPGATPHTPTTPEERPGA
jgi:hypothetical protein